MAEFPRFEDLPARDQQRIEDTQTVIRHLQLALPLSGYVQVEMEFDGPDAA